jgi:hypothetical protein
MTQATRQHLTLRERLVRIRRYSIAGLVLLIAGWVLLHFLIHIAIAIATVVIVIAAIIAAIWALRVLL